MSLPQQMEMGRSMTILRPTRFFNHARELERIPSREAESGDLSNRYIISLKTQLADQSQVRRRRLCA